jgi:hypothetical protein
MRWISKRRANSVIALQDFAKSLSAKLKRTRNKKNIRHSSKRRGGGNKT